MEGGILILFRTQKPNTFRQRGVLVHPKPETDSSKQCVLTALRADPGLSLAQGPYVGHFSSLAHSQAPSLSPLSFSSQTQESWALCDVIAMTRPEQADPWGQKVVEHGAIIAFKNQEDALISGLGEQKT